MCKITECFFTKRKKQMEEKNLEPYFWDIEKDGMFVFPTQKPTKKQITDKRKALKKTLAIMSDNNH